MILSFHGDITVHLRLTSLAQDGGLRLWATDGRVIAWGGLFKGYRERHVGMRNRYRGPDDYTPLGPLPYAGTRLASLRAQPAARHVIELLARAVREILTGRVQLLRPDFDRLALRAACSYVRHHGNQSMSMIERPRDGLIRHAERMTRLLVLRQRRPRAELPADEIGCRLEGLKTELSISDSELRALAHYLQMNATLEMVRPVTLAASASSSMRPCPRL